MFSYTFSEIAFILMSLYCVKCTWEHISNPEKTLEERDIAIGFFNWELWWISFYFLGIAAITVFWGLGHSKSDLSFYNFLGSQILNMYIQNQMINKTLLSRSKHLYLGEIWSTISWLLIACEILAKQSLF